MAAASRTETSENLAYGLSAQDSGFLLRLKPQTLDFLPQIRNARIGLGIFAALLLVCGIGLMLQSVISPNRPRAGGELKLGGVSSLSGVVSIIFACFPNDWLKPFALLLENKTQIQAIHENQRAVTLSAGQQWKLYATYAALLGLVQLGIYVGSQFGWLPGAAIIVPTVLIGIGLNFYRGHKNAGDFVSILEPLLYKNQYDSGTGLEGLVLPHSYLNSDSSFDIERSWYKPLNENAGISWCKFQRSGDAMTAGIACLIVAQHVASEADMARCLQPISSVYWDQETKTVYGVFNGGQANDRSRLANLPWQYCIGTLVSGLDDEVLEHVAEQQGINDEFVQQLVDSWELLAQEITATELTAKQNNSREV